jgi:hypothetical protein
VQEIYMKINLRLVPDARFAGDSKFGLLFSHKKIIANSMCSN